MTPEEYKQLETLLGKLNDEIGGKICIIPAHIHDGYYIGVYSSLSGKPYKAASGPTIEKTVEYIKQKQ
jgi:hypothetical protein